MDSKKKVAFVLRHSPYRSDFSQDAIDAVLAAGLYGQSVSVFFMGDGVFQLLEASSTTRTDFKPLSKKLKALSLYDIDATYVCHDSLNARAIEPKQLCIKAQVMDKPAINRLIRDNAVIVSF